MGWQYFDSLIEVKKKHQNWLPSNIGGFGVFGEVLFDCKKPGGVKNYHFGRKDIGIMFHVKPGGTVSTGGNVWGWGMRRWGSDEGASWGVLSRIVFNDFWVWLFLLFFLREATHRHCFRIHAFHYNWQWSSTQFCIRVSKQPPTRKMIPIEKVGMIIFHWQIRWPTTPSSTLYRVNLKCRSWRTNPLKSNIDTRNSHVWKEIHFPNHHFWYLW